MYRYIFIYGSALVSRQGKGGMGESNQKEINDCETRAIVQLDAQMPP
jgi:hypothetical protein